MFDSEHVVEFLQYLKDKPWISVGWHRHLWERPVLPVEEVASLVNEEGRFKWGHRANHLKNEVDYKEAYNEFMAQAELCKKYLGRYPDYASGYSGTILDEAFMDVLKELKIPTNFFGSKELTFKTEEISRGHHGPNRVVEDKYKHLHIYSVNVNSATFGYDLARFKDYDPLKSTTAVEWTDEEEIYFYGMHPGFVDDHILLESSCNLHRVKENIAARSKEYKQWIIDNHIELINFNDALNGTNTFQDHLKEINSPLWIGNMK